MTISVQFIRIQKVKRLSLGKKYKALVLSGPKSESVSINALESTVLIIQKPEIEWTAIIRTQKLRRSGICQTQLYQLISHQI